ncbi:hypothetical protein EYF80_029618 [Liparis tanakae]|uniref:Uncharacterized protein n=1 Tax=Liparis tanakae TaxID=230148 RepID=A0A4Z2H4H2_9TELE|nr:hypothetical protein EYF80_029618 [Liparis tanakae]
MHTNLWKKRSPLGSTVWTPELLVGCVEACSVGPECEQLSIVLEAERGRAVGQGAAVFEPVHHGNREATDSAAHGDLCSHSNGDVVRALDDLQPSRNTCKIKLKIIQVEFVLYIPGFAL